MTPQELKASILQLAIQGKLVEQRPEEGTGKDLYQQIQAEKQRLIKVGRIKKEKPIPEITEDEIPFEIPNDWKWVKLGELCSILTGKKDANFGSDTGKYCFFTCAKEPIRCNSYSFSGEAILMAGNGDIGNLSYYYGDFEAYQRTYVLQPYMEFSYLKYILHHLSCNWVSYNSNKTFGTAIPYIRLGNVQNYLVALPSLAEQKRIVAKIEELLPLIDRYEQAWSKLEEFNKRFPVDMQKSILQTAIQGKLVEQRPEEGTGEELYQQIQAEKQRLIKAGKIKKEKPLPEIAEDEIPFDIPESWKWVRLIDLCKSISDGDHQPPPQVPYGIPFLVISNVSAGSIDFSNTRYVPQDYFDALSADRVAEKGDVLFTVTGSYGIPIKVDCEQQFCFQRHIALLKLLVDWDYIYFALISPVIKAQCDAVATGTAQKTVGLKSLRSMLVPLPPLAEQKRIVAKLEEIFPLCERLK